MTDTIELVGGPDDGAVFDWIEPLLPAFLDVDESGTRYRPWTDRSVAAGGRAPTRVNAAGHVLYRYEGKAPDGAAS